MSNDVLGHVLEFVSFRSQVGLLRRWGDGKQPRFRSRGDRSCAELARGS